MNNIPKNNWCYTANINDWALKLKEIGDKVDFAKRIDEHRSVWFENLKKFNLPQIQTYTTSLLSFVLDPNPWFEKIWNDKCYFSLMPNTNLMRRFGGRDVTRQNLLAYIDQKIPGPNVKYYDIMIGPFSENIIWWNIIINRNWTFIFEFKKWTQTEIAKWTVESHELHFVKRDDFLDTFNFSFEDEYLRNVSHKALMKVPHHWRWRNIQFMPGYYEVVVVDKNWIPTVYFLDYRDNDAYGENLEF